MALEIEEAVFLFVFSSRRANSAGDLQIAELKRVSDMSIPSFSARGGALGMTGTKGLYEQHEVVSTLGDFNRKVEDTAPRHLQAPIIVSSHLGSNMTLCQ